MNFDEFPNMLRHPDITIRVFGGAEQYRRALGQNEPIFIDTHAWRGKAFVVKVSTHTPMGGDTVTEIVLRPTGAPERVLKGASRFPVTDGMVKVEIELMSRDLPRDMEGRIKRVLETQLAHTGRTLQQNIDAYRRQGPTFREWLLHGAPSSPEFTVPDYIPRGRIDVTTHNSKTRMLIDGIAAGVGVPASMLTTDPIKKETKLKKFYLGKPEVVEGRDHLKWAKDTLPEAIAHAEARARETGEPQYIVRVIKVVTVKPVPVVVKDVR